MNVLIRLDARRPKKDGTYPIILRLSSGETEETLPIATGYSVLKEYWDFEGKEIKRGYKAYGSVDRVNNILSDKRKIARDVVIKLDEAGELMALSIHEIRNRINSVFLKPAALKIIDTLRSENTIPSDKKKSEILEQLEKLVEAGELAEIKKKDIKAYFVNLIKKSSFLTYLNERELKLRKKKKVGTADTLKDLGGVLRSFIKTKDLYFNDITVGFLEKMEEWHLDKGNSINGFASYIRSFRATYNLGIKDGLADKDSSPFLVYSVKKTGTDKRVISKEYLSRIIDLNLESAHELFNPRNFFLSSYFMWGMSFIDMAFLPPDGIVDGRVKYKRSKTSRLYNIKLSDEAKALIDFYLDLAEPGEFIFPIIEKTRLDKELKTAKRAVGKCQRKFKKLRDKESSEYKEVKKELEKLNENMEGADRELYENRYRQVENARRKYNDQLKEIAKLCGIKENLTSYVTRHSFATRAKLEKAPIAAISQMLGHSDIRTTEIYLDTLPDDTIDQYADKALDFSEKKEVEL